MVYYTIFDNDDKQYYVSQSGNVINDGSENVETKKLRLIEIKSDNEDKTYKFEESITNYYITFFDNTTYEGDMMKVGGRYIMKNNDGTIKGNNKYLLNYNGIISTKKGDKEFKLKKNGNKINIENTKFYLKEHSDEILRNNYPMSLEVSEMSDRRKKD